MKKVLSIKRGDPLDTDTTMVGAQASEQQFDKILSYLEIAKGEGAELLTGGKVEKLEGNLATGFYIQPTLLKGTNKMRVFPAHAAFGGYKNPAPVVKPTK